MDKSVLKILKELEATERKFWNIPKEVGIFLNILIKTSNIKTILEIGTSNGVSSIYMAEALKFKNQKNSQIYTIESNYKYRFPLAQENFKKAKLEKYITQVLGHAPEAIPKSPKFFDLFFLDATKYEHIDYFKTILPRMKKTSIIITDNAISHQKSLTSYFAETKKHPRLKSFLLNLGSGLFVTLQQ